jgi:hypothetical protein
MSLLVEQAYLTEFCKVSSDFVREENEKIVSSDVNIMFESEAHTERGSPSLVGRGIANPMSERTRGFEMSKDSPS